MKRTIESEIERLRYLSRERADEELVVFKYGKYVKTIKGTSGQITITSEDDIRGCDVLHNHPPLTSGSPCYCLSSQDIATSIYWHCRSIIAITYFSLSAFVVNPADTNWRKYAHFDADVSKNTSSVRQLQDCIKHERSLKGVFTIWF